MPRLHQRQSGNDRWICSCIFRAHMKHITKRCECLVFAWIQHRICCCWQSSSTNPGPKVRAHSAFCKQQYRPSGSWKRLFLYAPLSHDPFEWFACANPCNLHVHCWNAFGYMPQVFYRDRIWAIYARTWNRGQSEGCISTCALPQIIAALKWHLLSDLWPAVSCAKWNHLAGKHTSSDMFKWFPDNERFLLWALHGAALLIDHPLRGLLLEISSLSEFHELLNSPQKAWLNMRSDERVTTTANVAGSPMNGSTKREHLQNIATTENLT